MSHAFHQWSQLTLVIQCISCSLTQMHILNFAAIAHCVAEIPSELKSQYLSFISCCEPNEKTARATSETKRRNSTFQELSGNSNTFECGSQDEQFKYHEISLINNHLILCVMSWDFVCQNHEKKTVKLDRRLSQGLMKRIQAYLMVSMEIAAQHFNVLFPLWTKFSQNAQIKYALKVFFY